MPDSANKRPHQNFRGRPNHQSTSKQTPTSKVRGDPWQSLSALQLGLEPRSFEQLHSERLYLLEMLQQHDQRAIELFKRVPIVDEQCKWGATVNQQRKAHRQRGWLRHRITEIVEGEKNILTRLSELHVEIQCRERWHQVEMERQMRNQGHQNTPTYMAFPPPPTFQPVVYQPMTGVYIPPTPYFYPHNPYRYGGTEEYDEAYRPPADYEEIHTEDHEAPTFEMDGTPINGESDIKPRSRSASLNTISSPKLKKRASMPSLHHTPGEESNDFHNHHTSPNSFTTD